MINIADLRHDAQRRLPKAVFDFLDGGAEDERTMEDNIMAFAEINLKPRCAVKPTHCDLSTIVLGQRIDIPVLLGPIGYSRLIHPQGELAAAAAARRANTIYCLPTMSGYAIEEVADHGNSQLWYQLYLVGGREVAERAISRAAACNFSALVLTIDTATSGYRERDLRNGVPDLLGSSISAKLFHLPSFLVRPRWLIRYLLDRGNQELPNIILPDRVPFHPFDIQSALEGAAITWQDISWIKRIWSRPVIIKGIQTEDDARRAVDAGAHAVIVSNHGGRQLDCVAGSVRILPRVVKAVGSQVEVLLDGGVRRGSDVIKALCYGARAVLLGRAYGYGLAARGEIGILQSLDIIREQLRRTMILLGSPSVRDLDRSFLDN